VGWQGSSHGSSGVFRAAPSACPRELAISNANRLYTRSVPTDHGVWLDDRQCVASDRKPPKQADEYQPIDAAEAWSLWGRPPQDVDLLA